MHPDKRIACVQAWLSGIQTANGLHRSTGIAPQTAVKAVKALKEWTPRRRSDVRGKEELQDLVDKGLDVAERLIEEGKFPQNLDKLITQGAKLGGHYEPEVSVRLQETHLRMTGDINIHGGREGAATAAEQMRKRLEAQRLGLPDPYGREAEAALPSISTEADHIESIPEDD
jgi:hypothetical protein